MHDPTARSSGDPLPEPEQSSERNVKDGPSEGSEIITPPTDSVRIIPDNVKIIKADQHKHKRRLEQ